MQPLDPPVPLPRTLHAGLAARWTGLVLGAGLAWLLAGTDRLGIGPGLGLLGAVPAFGLCAVAGVLVGDALTPKQTGTVRSAALTPRRVRDFLPLRLVYVLTGQATVLVTLLTGAALTASADDLGRAGRALTAACGRLTESHGPWPGLFYGVPILGALALTTAVCGYALHRVTRRPAPAPTATAEARESDERQRHDHARALTAAWGLTVCVPLAGSAFFAWGSLTSLSCLGATAQTLGWLLLPVAVTALGTALWLLFTLVTPRTTT
ncbi:hypothetical protein [Streptomyces sp. NPDC051909]|uniref:hypothetical protein n=1 Tax=Streptomyces sp. NPDC051909 TaxID=3154944 RepID=UPI00343C081F